MKLGEVHFFWYGNDEYPGLVKAGVAMPGFYWLPSTIQIMPAHAAQLKIHALIPCGGTGTRAGQAESGLPKQYRSMAGQAMVSHTLLALSQVPRVAMSLVVIAPNDALFTAYAVLPNAAFSVAACADFTRAATVFHGLNALLEQGAQRLDWVLVHDAARCLTTPAQINSLIDACLPDAVGGLLALKLPDTLKREQAGRAQETVDRADKWLAQTPQMFRIGALLDALQAAKDASVEVTDEASAMERLGHKPLLVPSSAQNFKVTYPEDFALAEAILMSRKNTT
jgi:2-C-methyl-D-erythritol 4-phosphate cytidylyltransferase